MPGTVVVSKHLLEEHVEEISSHLPFRVPMCPEIGPGVGDGEL